MKKKIKNILFGMVTMMTFLVMIKCNHSNNAETPSPDPCLGKRSTGAAFDISENAKSSVPGMQTYLWQNYVTDTVTNAMGFIDFQAADTLGLSYSWTIGAGTYTTKKVTIDFSSRPSGQNVIPITLTITKQHENSCFPSDTGTKTLSKLLVISDTSLVSGSFRGIKTDTLGNNPSDSFTVYLNPLGELVEYDPSHYPLDTIQTLIVSNLYPGCTNDSRYTLLAIGYKELFFGGGSGNCNNVGGRAILGPNNKQITIYYSYYNYTTLVYEHYIFKGILNN